MDLHKYIPAYPDIDSPNIAEELMAYKEIRELQGDKTERFPKPGQFFKHQELTACLLTWYSRFLKMDETGTGKSGSIIKSAETLLNNPESTIRQVIILEIGETNSKDFRSQVMKIMPHKYTTVNQVNRVYTIRNYGQFVNSINSDGTNTPSAIEQNYSDTLFFCDEAHRLRNLKSSGDVEEEFETCRGTTKQGKPCQNKGPYCKTHADLDDGSAQEPMGNIYTTLHDIFRYAKRSKVVISTATPFVNSVNDFVPLLNLLLPWDQQLPFGINYKHVSIDMLEPYIRGKIMFVKRLKQNVNRIEIGKPVDFTHILERPVECSDDLFEKVEIEEFEKPSDLILYKTRGSLFQNIHYKKNCDKIAKCFNREPAYASNFVFPDGSTGSVGYNKYFDKKGKMSKDLIKALNGDMSVFVYSKGKAADAKLKKREMAKLEKIEDEYKGLWLMSTKFYHIIKKEMESEYGSFIYIEDVHGVGAILLSKMFSFFGSERFNPGSKYVVAGRIRGLKKKKRHYDLTGDNKSKITEVLRVKNNPDNYKGEYLQTIIASKVAREGINIKNSIRGYIASPTWHFSGEHQALSRIIRADAFFDILRALGRVDVEIYRMAFDPEEGESKDVSKYLKSEEKNYYIEKMMNGFKRHAIDYRINYARNHQEEEDGFEDDLVNCMSGMKLDVKTNNYYTLYRRQGIDRGKNYIRKFKNPCSVLYIDNEKKHDPIILRLAAEELQSEFYYIRDQFGFKQYLRLMDNFVYFSKLPRTKVMEGRLPSYCNHLVVTKEIQEEEEKMKPVVIEDHPLEDLIEKSDPELGRYLEPFVFEVTINEDILGRIKKLIIPKGTRGRPPKFISNKAKSLTEDNYFKVEKDIESVGYVLSKWKNDMGTKGKWLFHRDTYTGDKKHNKEAAISSREPRPFRVNKRDGKGFITLDPNEINLRYSEKDPEALRDLITFAYLYWYSFVVMRNRFERLKGTIYATKLHGDLSIHTKLNSYGLPAGGNDCKNRSNLPREALLLLPRGMQDRDICEFFEDYFRRQGTLLEMIEK